MKKAKEIIAKSKTPVGAILRVRQQNKGITLIALVITIIVMLILVIISVSYAVNGGLFNKAIEATFRAEMAQIREMVEQNNLNQQVEIIAGTGATEGKIFTKVTVEEAKKWPTTLKVEIVNWGTYDIEVNELSDNYIKKNFENIVKDENNNEIAKGLFYITSKEYGNNKYVYNEETDIIYKVKTTKINGNKIHSVEELDYLKNGGKRIKSKTNYTKISQNCEIKQVGELKYYEPNLTGLAKETTSLLFYKKEEGKLTGDVEPKTVTEWLEQGKPNEITIGQDTYVFYDYENNLWANIKVESSGVETNWTWIPRYSFYNEGTTTNVAFVDIEGNPLNKEEGEFQIAPAFEENQKKGIWVSKYEPTNVASTNTTSYIYYIPDIKGLDLEHTYVELYNNDGTSFDLENKVKLSTITNLAQFAKNNNWFDYYNKKWANIMVEKNGIETWWVWIPRYVFKNEGSSTDAILVGLDDNPLDGSQKPSGYELAPAFEKGDGKKGIWVCKYEPTNVATTYTQDIKNTPDITGLDKESTELAIYSEDGKTFVKYEKLSKINNLSKFAQENNWYNYKEHKWANIKVTKNNVETWWVWIPRYIFKNTGNSTDVILVDLNDNPIDGSKKPLGYELAPAFEKGDKKQGMWVCKYEPTEIK